MKRFIKEYASYIEKSILENDLMQVKYKEEKTAMIKKVLSMAERQIITVNEVMKMLSNI